ncbi:hypothetical protein [Marinobacter fonticola]|uniref:hypothetical protein n=1 Tax=Marinobacter fonticola TaxID=2603215 RepID=UPI0011E896C3|nr:hypothetical protein [Marinobacter fonticola]
MRRELWRRLEAIEKDAGVGQELPIIWVSRPNADNEHLPPAGWTETIAEDPVTVMREPGESDASLQARMIAEFRAKPTFSPKAAGIFTSINADCTEKV